MSPGRTALITGGGQGIGRAVALGLAARGDRVVVCGRKAGPLEAVVRQIQGAGGRGMALPADLRCAEQVDELFSRLNACMGDVEILVTCAVASRVANFVDLVDEDWLTHFETKVLGAVRCMRQVIPSMESQGWGRIVNLAGTTARLTAPGRATNGMANAAIANISMHVAQEVADKGILVNAVHPGMTDTPRLNELIVQTSANEDRMENETRATLRDGIPTKRFIQPDEIAEFVMFLCSDANRSITGQSLAIDGGMANVVTY